MFFFPMDRIKNTAKTIGFLVIVFIIAGCVAQKTQDVQTSEQQQMHQETADKTAVTPGDRQISSILVREKNQVIEVMIQGNEKLVWSSIKQAFPFGIAIYLLETKISDNLKTTLSDNQSIGDVIVTYADKEESNVKVEILLKEDLGYEVTEQENALKLVLFGSVDKDAIVASEKGDTNSTATPAIIAEKADDQEIIISDKTAIMTNIEFNTLDSGKSDIVVKTNHPVKYDVSHGSDGKLYLNLYNTIIPDYHKRPILTQYFKSAVKSLMPMEEPGPKKNSKIEINTRETVPYRIVRNQNIISMYFEPSNVVPPVFTKAKKKVISGETRTQLVQMQGEDTSMAAGSTEVNEKRKSIEEQIYGPKKVYTGEKIKLDFYETDIKNVIRILRSVGGLNFAIDKDVQGKVTLSLEDPVPWDQVLDLVLKMNNLGQKKEGNVIRIATLSTIKKEEKMVQDKIAARKKALEQKKSLEPLVTEYIPINYSDADADVKPHLTPILSKRGSITVDKRTNMIIINDTQAKVDQAQEIIYRLDKVTPQIMIEAKVVEVSKNFSRELGLGMTFNRSREKGAAGDGGDFSIALNRPSSVSMGSFNFYRVLGSNFLSMNAQIAASETKGDVKVVSSPRIMTLDNKSAKIKQGLEYAYLERDDTGGSSVKFKNIDLLLEVTPHVTPDKRIAMNVHLTKNDIQSITDGVPSLSTNEAETELLVNDNDTIVIGGIVKTTDSKGKAGTPYLSGIPILGRLFRTDTDSDKRNELLIFITPSIVQLEQKRNKYTSSD